jgi:hypothetical protein
MLSLKINNCRECSQIHLLIDKINCQLAKMAKNLSLNISFMLDKPVEGCKMSTLIHYKRILTYKSCNPDWVSNFSIKEIASRVSSLTVNCQCCDSSPTIIEEITTTTTTTTILP